MKIAGTGEVRKGYTRDQFADAWDRYLSAPSPSPRYEPLPATDVGNNSELSENWPATDPLPFESSAATGGSVADQETAGSVLGSGINSATSPVKYSEVAGSGWKRGDGGNDRDEVAL